MAALGTLKITYLPPAQLVPYAKNARTHSPAQVQQIAQSIQAFGFTNPLLVDGKKGLIAGHGRLLAAQSLKLAKVPVIIITGLSEAKKRALILADNKLALNAGWDPAILRLELAEIGGELDAEITGFSADEIAKLMGDAHGLTDPDEVPAAVPAISKSGDVWILGNHRLICGDSTDAAVVARLLGPVKPHLMVTDPPYGVNYDPTKARATSKGSARGKVSNDDRSDWAEAWEHFPGNVAYIWHGMLHSAVVVQSIQAVGFVIRAEIVWDKGRLVLSRGDYHPQHESAWYAVRKGKSGGWAGDRKQTTVWDIPKAQKNETGHSTQKPVECMKRPIENNSSVGQAVYEPFSGSGTTIIAAEMTGRHCYAIELNPGYVDIAVKRWENFTGKKAILDGAKKERGAAKQPRQEVGKAMARRPDAGGKPAVKGRKDQEPEHPGHAPGALSRSRRRQRLEGNR